MCLSSTMSPHTNVLLLITLWASMKDGLGHPVMQQLEVEAGEDAPTQKVRTKRCACSSLLDSECHYFCHLDIIWINTPSKTTVYGLGSALSRRRRSTGRCTCANTDDQSCTNFCRHRAAAGLSTIPQRSPDSDKNESSQSKNTR